jgi:hypothetical protein
MSAANQTVAAGLVAASFGPFLSPPTATLIGTGFCNTFIACRDGWAYCFTNIYAPVQRTLELDVKHTAQVEGGYCHTLAWTIKGHIYLFGYSQLRNLATANCNFSPVR